MFQMIGRWIDTSITFVILVFGLLLLAVSACLALGLWCLYVLWRHLCAYLRQPRIWWR